MKTIKRANIFTTLIMLLVLNTAGLITNAQVSCTDEAINEAQKKYNIGLFYEVKEDLRPCLEKGLNRSQKAEAYRLIALSNLALDSITPCIDASKKILEVKPNFEPGLFAPNRFVEIINDLKNKSKSQLVTSVSKKEENVHEAPATVVLVTEEEIINRGYQNIEQIFHDLPGFNISRGRGANYSNLYQRGYRSILTDRTILLIDGVEQNDLSSDNAPISRQYPLSNIKRIEVIYGPASTMYGANAFLGVINIVTKDNDEVIKDKFGININSSYSSMNTKYVDATLGAKFSENTTLSVTARYFKSDEMDISSYDSWDFTHTNIDYQSIMNITGTDASGNYLANNYVQEYRLDTLASNGLYNINYNSENMATGISLTNEGIAEVDRMDEQALYPNDGKYSLGIDPSVRDWYAKAKLEIKDLTFGIETWRSNEGCAPWYSDSSYLFREDHMRWINWNSNFYINFEKSINKRLLFTNIASYRLHTVDGGTNFETFSGFYNSRYSFYELATGAEPTINTTYYYRTSNQAKNDMRFLWFPNDWIDVMSGIEFRSSLVQGDYLRSQEVDPDETGETRDYGILGTDHFRTLDLGIYSQATIKIGTNINSILGGRIDNNRIRQNGGYGTVFNPRLAMVFSPGNWIIKAIYATAFKDASYLQKYATVTGVRELPNPTLKPEKVKNYELSAFWKPLEGFSLDAAVYNAFYSDVVGTATVTLPDGSQTGQFQPIGEQHIYGGQLSARYTYEKYSFWGNYTYTNPQDKKLNLRISDIASHQYNAGIVATYFDKIVVHFRTNYVGERLTGKGTSGSQNMLSRFDPYMVFHGNIGVKNLIKGLKIQVGAENIFNTEYFDPGVRAATAPYAYRTPQYKRILMLKLLYTI